MAALKNQIEKIRTIAYSLILLEGASGNGSLFCANEV